MSTLSTHVLDTAEGCPASGIRVVLETRAGTPLGEGVTDHDGRIGSLGGELARRRLRAPVRDRRACSSRRSSSCSRSPTSATTTCRVLLSPYGYSTYRGS